jgi:hypothetical protein
MQNSYGRALSSLTEYTHQLFLYYALNIIDIFITICGAVAHLARAPRLHRGGKEFDSPQLHQDY